ncbi:MAG: hypothetical protein AAGE61_13455 [Pseudomonadota bacterium]
MAIQHNDLVRSLAFIYMRHGYHRRAKALFELLVKSDPDDIHIRLSLASVLVKCGRAGSALEVLMPLENNVLEDQARKFFSLVMSEALQQLGRLNEARQFFDQYRANGTAHSVKVAP